MEIIKKDIKETVSDKAAASIATIIIRLQISVAGWLSRYDKRMRPGQRKILYATIAILAFACLVFILTRALTAPDHYRIKAQWLKVSEDTSRSPKDHSPVFFPLRHGNRGTFFNH
ncbi:hypothetical protein [Chitinophaga sp. OAE865]|uniref:hypothetical protein n=1 Tax=Chitinophaga sp. OAE865 TaxID=2817898 RepID=UPI001AE17DE2